MMNSSMNVTHSSRLSGKVRYCRSSKNITVSCLVITDARRIPSGTVRAWTGYRFRVPIINIQLRAEATFGWSGLAEGKRQPLQAA